MGGDRRTADVEGTMRRIRAILRPLGAGLLIAAAACAVNPATGEREFSLVSESQEIQYGREADPAITAQMGGLYPDSALQRYVRDIGLRMAASSERPSLPWSYKLLDDELINAFALPGGFIYVTRGILANMNSEAELAAVLGHETGHVTARHSASQITRQQLAQIGLGVGSVLSETVRDLGQVAAAGLQLLFLKYGRDDERQADELGFRYMTALRYHPAGMTAVMQMLSSTSPADDASGVPSWLSSHPDPGDRVQANERRIAQSGVSYATYTTNHDDFIQRLDGLVYGVDPRQGYFLAQRFLHPTLQFEITFPSGWATRNSAQAVQAISSARDAAMSLTFANASSAAEAAGRIASMQGMTVIRRSRDRINGLPAEFVEFQAQTQDGVLQGIAMYADYRNAVYEVLGYAVQARWSSYAGTVDGAIRSLAPLTDRRLLDVSPHRIQIVRLPRAMSFSQFAQQYPSSVPIDNVRLANQVSQDEMLQAGRLMKRITGGRVPQQP
jgi:predicted Zn-dependent protease